MAWVRVCNYLKFNLFKIYASTKNSNTCPHWVDICQHGGGEGEDKLTYTQQSDGVMLSEIVWFHALQPLLSAFGAVLESSLPL